jgi:hypothetical protein
VKFLVDDNQRDRHTKIRSFLTEEAAVIAVLLAAADLEWTLRRAIRALGTAPTADLRDERISSLNGYKNLWKAEVSSHTSVELDQVIGDWAMLVDAYTLRHQLIHGAQGTTGLAYAAPRVERVLDASRKTFEFAKNHGVDLCARLPVRLRPK